MDIAVNCPGSSDDNGWFNALCAQSDIHIVSSHGIESNGSIGVQGSEGPTQCVRISQRGCGEKDIRLGELVVAGDGC